MQFSRFYQPEQVSKGVGRTIESSDFPSWSALTGEGFVLRLYTTIEETSFTTSYGTNGTDVSQSVSGEALIAEVEFSRQCELAFCESTVASPRVFFLGSTSNNWPNVEDTTWVRGDTETSTCRCSLVLSNDPDVRIFAGGIQVGLPSAGWMTFESIEEMDAFSYSSNAARSFISILNGRRVTFAWQDTFREPNKVVRSYFGHSRTTAEVLDSPNLEPLPISYGVEGLSFSRDVVRELPKLYASFRSIQPDFNFEWVLHPIWTAMRGILDDRTALACVSLERLACEWRKLKMKDETNHDNRNLSVWKDKRLIAIQEKILCIVENESTILEQSVGGKQLVQAAMSAIRKRVRNLLAPPNADQLMQVFDDLELHLNESDRRCLDERNKALHGKQTLREPTPLEYDAECQRFDTIRMLVTKAIFKILNYEGPLIDYATKPASGNFPVIRLSDNLA